MKIKILILFIVSFVITYVVSAQKPITHYYESGKIKETGFFNDTLRTGKWIAWDEQGHKIAEVYYLNGKKDGNWIMWDSNGVKRYELFYSNGEKKGFWKMWDERGNLLSEKDYTASK